MKFTPKQTFIIIAASAIATALSATPIAIDQFDYPGNNTVIGDGSAADAGWNEAWRGGGGSQWYVLSGGSLTGTDASLAPVGNRVVSSGNRAFRNFDSSYSDATTQTLYMSFLREEASTGNSSAYMALELFNGGDSDGANRTFQLGALSGDAGAVGGANVAARANNATVSGSLGARTTDSEYFILKFELVNGGNDTIGIWRDPSTASFNEASPDASITVGSFAFDRVALASFGGTDLRLDEFRFGTSLSDISAIPEPSTFAFIGLALVSLLYRYRRK